MLPDLISLHELEKSEGISFGSGIIPIALHSMNNLKNGDDITVFQSIFLWFCLNFDDASYKIKVNKDII